MTWIERVLPATRSWPLFDAAATRALEQAALAARPPHTLMRRAGEAVARLALAVAPHARRVFVAAGPGNNGGDGLDAAIHLRAAGRDVRVVLLGPDDRRPADAADALQRARDAGVPIGEPPAAWLDGLGADDLSIDALLGVGASRAPAGAVLEEVHRLAALRAPCLAVDLPTGLDGDRGTLLGGIAVHATHTLALLTLKPGLFTGAGRDTAGHVWFADLGVPAGATVPVATLVGADALSLLREPRSHSSHKGSFGDLAIIGGAPGMAGAAVLAARAGAMAGAGRTYLQLLDAHAAALDAGAPELMWRAHWLDGPAADIERAVVVAGCGGGTAIRGVLPRVLGTAGRLVLDADALNAIAADAALATLLRARAGRGRATVLTPHPLEAARLLGRETRDVQADRLGSARQLAATFGSIVVLKGSGSVIASPDGHVALCGRGSAALACAGTGDVLAGALGGLWAEVAEVADQALLLPRLHAGVAWHALAGEAVSAGPVGASALIDAMRARRAG